MMNVVEEFLDKGTDEIVKHLDEKSPTAEQFLLEIAKQVGLSGAKLFDGTVVKFGADEPSNS